MLAWKPNMKPTSIMLGMACVGLLASFFLPVLYVRWGAAALLTLAALAMLSLIKKRSILSFHKRKVWLTLAVFAAVFLMIYYVSGLFCGFYQALYPLSLTSFGRFILPILVIILASEMIRYVALAVDSKAVYLLTYAVGVLSELAIRNGFLYINNVYGLMDFVGLTLLPALTANVLLNYTSKHYGYLPGMTYRAVLSLYSYVLPAIPATPDILPAFVLLLLPLFILLFIKALFAKRTPMAARARKKNKWAVATGTVWVALLAAFVMLISCQFHYGMIVIGSGSMADELHRGDAVVYEAYEGEPVQENDIIIFQKDMQTRVVHRVVAIESVQGQTRYITKGDANDVVDSGYVTEDQIVGIVRLKVLYVGYPSLWLREIWKG